MYTNKAFFSRHITSTKAISEQQGETRITIQSYVNLDFTVSCLLKPLFDDQVEMKGGNDKCKILYTEKVQRHDKRGTPRLSFSSCLNLDSASCNLFSYKRVTLGATFRHFFFLKIFLSCYGNPQAMYHLPISKNTNPSSKHKQCFQI